MLLTGVLRATEAENIVVPRTPSWQVQIRWLEEDGAQVTAGQKIIEFDNSAFAGTIEDKKGPTSDSNSYSNLSQSV